MIVAFIAAVACAAGAVYWLVARRHARPPSPVARPSKAGGRFSGVEIRTRSGACRAAHLLQKHRFLLKNAPALPLRECTAARCACTFSKLSDRRTDDGRRLDHGGLGAQLFHAINRRARRDRRRAAQAQHHS